MSSFASTRLILAAIILSTSSGVAGASYAPARAYANLQAAPAERERQAIHQVLKKELGRTTRHHVKISRFTLTDLDVQSGWALAGVEPAGNSGDPFMVLLRKRGGRWRMLVLGTNLRGVGRQYNVPRALWDRWDLGDYQ